MKSLRPIDFPSIHQEVQDRIKEYILANELQPDDPLPSETQLADQLGVSRAVVREALRSLESLGVIYSRRGAGRYVSRFSLDPIVQNLSYGMLFGTEDLEDILAVRERLEAAFIPDAVLAMDQDSLNQMRVLVDQMYQKAAAGEEFLEEDMAFHRAIYLVIGNRLLTKLLDIFRDVYENLRERSLSGPTGRDLNPLARDHAEILQAIEARDVELARQRLMDHFDGIKRRLKVAQLASGDSAGEVPSTKATEDTSH